MNFLANPIFSGKSIGNNLKHQGILAKNYHFTSNITYFGVIWNKKGPAKMSWKKPFLIGPCIILEHFTWGLLALIRRLKSWLRWGSFKSLMFSGRLLRAHQVQRRQERLGLREGHWGSGSEEEGGILPECSLGRDTCLGLDVGVGVGNHRWIGSVV